MEKQPCDMNLTEFAEWNCRNMSTLRLITHLISGNDYIIKVCRYVNRLPISSYDNSHITKESKPIKRLMIMHEWGFNKIKSQAAGSHITDLIDNVLNQHELAMKDADHLINGENTHKFTNYIASSMSLINHWLKELHTEYEGIEAARAR